MTQGMAPSSSLFRGWRGVFVARYWLGDPENSSSKSNKSARPVYNDGSIGIPYLTRTGRLGALGGFNQHGFTEAVFAAFRWVHACDSPGRISIVSR